MSNEQVNVRTITNKDIERQGISEEGIRMVQLCDGGVYFPLSEIMHRVNANFNTAFTSPWRKHKCLITF